MSQFPHLQLVGGVTGVPYARPPRPGPTFQTPPRDRAGHASSLRQSVDRAIADGTAELRSQGVEAESRGIQLTLESSSGFDLKLESLENRTAGIRLLQAWTRNQVQRAVVFVPRTAFGVLAERIRQYEQEETRAGAPRNRLLVESIDRIRLSMVEDLWADASDFPRTDLPMWWEVWLPIGPDGGEETYNLLAGQCRNLAWDVGRRWLEFSERIVTLVKARPSDWGRSRVMLELVAELRSPVEPAVPYLSLNPRDQGEWVRDLQRRLRVALPTARRSAFSTPA